MPFPVTEPLSPPQLLDAFKPFGVLITLDPGAPQHQQTLGLAHGLVGAVERHAMCAEYVAQRHGAGSRELGETTGYAFNGANCKSPADDLQLLSWEATWLTQRIHEIAALEKGAPQAGGQRFFADLLRMTD